MTLTRWTYRNARRLVVSLIGATFLLIGVALLVLPGPGTLSLLVGLAILATEWVWARRLLSRLKKEGKEVTRTLREVLGFPSKKEGPPGGGP